MNDLISRQAAIDKVVKESQVDGAYGYMDTKSLIDLLEDLSSAQPEIVRCRDCKHYDSRPCGIVDWWNTADDYCSRAEMRGETDEID